MARIEVTDEEFFSDVNTISENTKISGGIHALLMPEAVGKVYAKYFGLPERQSERFAQGCLDINFADSTKAASNWDRFREIVKKSGYLDAVKEQPRLLAQLTDLNQARVKLASQIAVSFGQKTAHQLNQLQNIPQIGAPRRAEEIRKATTDQGILDALDAAMSEITDAEAEIDALLSEAEAFQKRYTKVQKSIKKLAAAKKPKKSGSEGVKPKIVPVNIPFELKDSFKRAIPSATWNSLDRRWNLAESDLGLLIEWQWDNSIVGDWVRCYRNDTIDWISDSVFGDIERDLTDRVSEIQALKRAIENPDELAKILDENRNELASLEARIEAIYLRIQPADEAILAMVKDVRKAEKQDEVTHSRFGM